MANLDRSGAADDRRAEGPAPPADAAALAADIARLHQAERQARAQAAAAQARLAFLAEASTLLIASLDYETTLRSVVRLAVPRLADWCIVYIREEDGSVRRLAGAHADPAKEALIAELDRRYPVDPDAQYGVASVLRSGEPVVYTDVSEERLAETTRDHAHFALIRDLGWRSAVLTPLPARGTMLGVVGLMSATDGHRYGPDDVALAQELARRAALAIDNARLYREARQAEAASQRQAARMTALAEASHAFSEAQLDLDDMLATVARQAAELVGELCVIRLVSEDGAWLEPASLHHADPDLLAAARSTFRRQRIDEGWQGQVVRTGRTALLAPLSLEALRASIKPDHWSFYERYGVWSFMVVLLRARGRVLGTLTVGRQHTRPAFAPEDRFVVEDLADRAALAVDNARLYQEAQAAIRRRDEFLSIASHELKTPVAGLKGYIQLLHRSWRRGSLDEARLARSLQTLNETADRLATLTDDLLDIARIRMGHLALRPEPLDLAALVGEVAARYGEGLAEGYRLTARLDLAPCPVVGDAARLEQVLTNLIDNAIKYSPNGGAIAVALEADGEGVRLSVRDEGIGLPPGTAETIFTPFGRAPNAAERHLPGMGLGLAICRSIVERHDGRIWATSDGEDRGTTMWIWLPAPATAARAPDAGQENENPLPPSEEG